MYGAVCIAKEKVQLSINDVIKFSFIAMQDFGLSGIRVAALYSRNQGIIAALRNLSVFYSTPLYIQVFQVIFFNRVLIEF